MAFIAVKMLLYKKLRFLSTVVAVGFAFFLSAAQIGIMVGWCNTVTGLITHSRADIWVMAPRTRTFDYATLIPQQRIFQVRTVQGVEWAEGMIVSWTFWQTPDGRTESIELVGLDEDLVGGPWEMHEGTLESVKQPESVVIDELYRPLLGVTQIGDEVEIVGSRAVVRAICRGIRTFTASPYVFTTLEQAIRYDGRAKPDEIMYVMVRCKSGENQDEMCRSIMASVPQVEAVRAEEFRWRTIKYWMLETGAGITVTITAMLGLVVSTVIISQTLFAITNDHLREYGTMLALGFSRIQLTAIVVTQSLVFGLLGIFTGTGLFSYAVQATAHTTIPIEFQPSVFLSVVGAAGLSAIFAALVSVRLVFRVDPALVFYG